MAWSEAVFSRSTFCLKVVVSGLLLLSMPALAGVSPVSLEPADGSLTCFEQSPTPERLSVLQALYQDRDSLWQEGQRLQALIEALQQLADDGLNPDEYRLSWLGTLAQLHSRQESWPPCADRQVSHAYLRALQHLHWGRLAQQQQEPFWRAHVQGDPAATLLRLARAGLQDPAEAFALARPAHPRYRQLREAYARQRLAPLPEWLAIPAGPLLRPGMTDERVPLLAQRLAAIGELQPSSSLSDDTRYDPALVEAVKAYQARHGLSIDGVVGPDTLVELNISPATRLDQLRINLERLRWLARDLEPDMLLVDIAGAWLYLYRDGELAWQTRTQVGRAERPTPSLKSTVTHLTLNPTWTVPPTILREDKLPQIRRDPTFLARQAFEVLDYQGERLDPATVDWDDPRGILLRQPAGPGNPLGQVVLRFANPFAVYLHDTPSQGLFASNSRAYSSGCVRVETALSLVDRLLEAAERESVGTRLASGLTRTHHLAQPVPIVMAYWTAEADAQGRPRYRPDLYHRDRPLISTLNRALVEAPR